MKALKSLKKAREGLQSPSRKVADFIRNMDSEMSNFLMKWNVWLKTRDSTITTVKELVQYLNNLEKDINITGVTTASIAATAFIVGALLAPITLGTSLVVGAVGATATGAEAAASATKEFIKYHQQNQIEGKLKADSEITGELVSALEELLCSMHDLAEELHIESPDKFDRTGAPKNPKVTNFVYVMMAIGKGLFSAAAAGYKNYQTYLALTGAAGESGGSTGGVVGNILARVQSRVGGKIGNAIGRAGSSEARWAPKVSKALGVIGFVSNLCTIVDCSQKLINKTKSTLAAELVPVIKALDEERSQLKSIHDAAV